MKFEDVYRVVKLIPRGMVMSYSGVARLCGSPRSARYVGFALYALPADTRVPWWRVINAQGRISNQYAPDEQRRRLEAEGVVVNDEMRVDMRLFDAEAIVYRKLRRAEHKPNLPASLFSLASKAVPVPRRREEPHTSPK